MAKDTNTAAAPKRDGKGRFTKKQTEAAAKLIANLPGSRIVAALEECYADIRERHSDLPEIVFITGSGVTARGLKWAHFGRERWVQAQAEGRLAEMFIGGETLAKGPIFTLETILHEAAHALACNRDIADCSREGHYHNGEFKKLAEELGLAWPEDTKPHRVLGYSKCLITDETTKSYETTIKRLAEKLEISLDTLAKLGIDDSATAGAGGDKTVKLPKSVTDAAKKTKTDRNYLKAQCACESPRTIRVSRKTYDEAEIVCKACESPFKAPESVEETESDTEA